MSRQKPKTRIRAGTRWYHSPLDWEGVKAAVEDPRPPSPYLEVQTADGRRVGISRRHVSVWEELEE